MPTGGILLLVGSIPPTVKMPVAVVSPQRKVRLQDPGNSTCSHCHLSGTRSSQQGALALRPWGVHVCFPDLFFCVTAEDTCMLLNCMQNETYGSLPGVKFI